MLGNDSDRHEVAFKKEVNRITNSDNAPKNTYLPVCYINPKDNITANNFNVLLYRLSPAALSDCQTPGSHRRGRCSMPYLSIWDF